VNSTVSSSIFFGMPEAFAYARSCDVSARARSKLNTTSSAKRGSVVEFHAGPQLETPGGRVDLRPRLGQRRHEPELLVAHDQEFVDELVDVVGEILVLRMRVGGLHVAAARPAQGFRVGIERGVGERRREREGERDARQGACHRGSSA
jgi:hypothetical protein